MAYNPNPSFNPALAIALMPTENFAQKRADAAAAMQFEMYNADLAKQSVEAKQKALADVQTTLSAVDRANLLEPDKNRLRTAIALPLREQAESVLRNEYGGDIERFMRERGSQLTNQFAKQLTSSPLYSKATTNMTNYTLAQEAKKKGHMLVGDFDKEWEKYATGQSDAINYRGSYEPPKNVFEYFNQNHKAGYEYGQFVGRDKRSGQEIYRPVQVTAKDLMDRLVGTGLSPQEAADYAAKINYQGGRAWKMDSQSPWDYRKEQNTERHQQVGEAQGWAQIGIARAREARELAKDKAEAAGKAESAFPTILKEVYLGNGSVPLTLSDGRQVSVGGQAVRVKDKIPGKTGEVLLKAIGIGGEKAVLDKDGYRTTDTYIESNLTEARTPNGQVVFSKDRKPLQLKQVDATRLYYYPDKANGFEGYQPRVKAVARIDGKEVTVMIPVPYNELTKGELVNQGAIYNSKEDRAQGVLPDLPAAVNPLYSEFGIKPLR